MAMNAACSEGQPLFTRFKRSVSDLPLPERFTFPFYYDVHPLCRVAAEELQEYLGSQRHIDHNFGLDDIRKGLIIGKMFGVMVVRNRAGELGYLSAFSGKLANSNFHEGFVPPVFDLLLEEGFFRVEEQQLTQLTERIESLQADPEFLLLIERASLVAEKASLDLKQMTDVIKRNKKERDAIRKAMAPELSENERKRMLEDLVKQSLREQYTLKDRKLFWKAEIALAQQRLKNRQQEIEGLLEERAERSAKLQREIFEHYQFLNANGASRSLLSIFDEHGGIMPPAGSGECAAPKLLQYAFLHELEPIAMAEFWWGASPKSEIRKHGSFYASCKGKCEPILSHMLQGLKVDPNPLLETPGLQKDLTVVYEDEHLLVINKPEEFLSVPGKAIQDSVQTRMREIYPHAEGPMIVHRLDMATSGLLLVAKSKAVHAHLQRQFLKRQVEKRYVAILDGVVKQREGLIDLPLRLDLDDRPRQLVCYTHGKQALTRWERIAVENGKTRIFFYPQTGRTHQLRVHAAHPDGLNLPIVGDDLYGSKDRRLHLHAEQIRFQHPVTRTFLTIQVEPDF